MTKMVASLVALRRNPNRMIMSPTPIVLVSLCKSVREPPHRGSYAPSTFAQFDAERERAASQLVSALQGQTDRMRRPDCVAPTWAPYAEPVIWSRHRKASPDEEREGRIQGWGNRMAKTLEQTPDETLQESEQVLKWSLRKYGPDSPFTIKAANEVANQLAFQGRVDEEVPHRTHIVDALRKSEGLEDEATLNAELKLATCLISLDRPDEAEPLLAHVVAGRTSALGGADPQTLAAVAWSATVAKKRGRLDDARRLQERVVEGYASRDEGESPQALLATLNLAATLSDLEQLDEARRLVQIVLEVRTRTLGPDDPKTREVEMVLQAMEAEGFQH